MDKKKVLKSGDDDDNKGFEEFIEGQPSNTRFLPKGVGGGSKKIDAGFEHFTFLTDDGQRLLKLKNLLSDKLPFASKFDQSEKLIKEQKDEIDLIKKKLFDVSDKSGSPYLKSIGEIFNSYFDPGKK